MHLKKNTLAKYLLILTTIVLGGIYSCDSNSCASFDCINGECDRGTCVCEDGWQGTSCNTPWAQKFIGNFEGRDCYDTGTARYTLSGTRRPDSILFDNRFYAIVTGETELEFPTQEAEQDGATFTLEGEGSIQESTLTILLRYKYESFDVQCPLTLTRE